MSATFTPVFNRKGKLNKRGLYLIHIRVTIGSTSRYLNSNLSKLRKEHWSGKPNRWISDKNDNHYKFNQVIQTELAELNSWADRMMLNRSIITFQKVSDYYSLKGDRNLFNIYAGEYLRKTKFTSYRNKQKHETFLNHFNEFMPKVYFNELNEKLFHEFRDFLRDVKGHKGSTQDKHLTSCRE